MKKFVKAALVFVFALSLVMGIAACGGNNPKSLAKQNAEILQQTQKLLITDGVALDDPKVTALQKKADAVREKVSKLSEADREIFEDEWDRLMDEMDL